MRRFCLILTFLMASAAARGQSTFAEDDHFAWGANVGWISFVTDSPNPGDGVTVYSHWLGGYAWAANLGWINFGNGAPPDGVSYSNATNTDFGVNQDGAGNLSGLAWSENAGWINFGWATNGDPNRPRFDVQDGNFSGYAWGANIGWINVGSGFLRTESIRVVDKDHDGIADEWEIRVADGLETLGPYPADADEDSISDYEEYIADTDATIPGGGVLMTRINNVALTNLAQIGWSSSPAREYAMETATNFPSGWIEIGTVPGAQYASETVTQVLAARTQTSFRVRAKLPLTP